MQVASGQYWAVVPCPCGENRQGDVWSGAAIECCIGGAVAIAATAIGYLLVH